MIEEKVEGLKKRQRSRIWNSIGLFSLISFAIYLLYMSIIFPFLVTYVTPINFSGSVLLYLTILVLVAFIFWLVTFYMQFNPHFYGEPTKFSWVTKRNLGILIGLFALIIVVLFLPAYYISIVLPFRASEDQIKVLERLSEKKKKGQL